VAPEFTYYQVTSELDVVELHDTTIGDGRLKLRTRTSTDGAITPLALFDSALAVDCEPTERGGTAVCEPVYAPVATLFADATCEQPAVAISASESDQPQPLVAQVESDDCPTYHTFGPELTTTVYRLDRNACVPISRGTLLHYYALADEATLAPIDRSVEASPHRLQRIIAATDDIAAYGTRLVDNAIRGECARVMVGEVERCLPTSTIVATDLYAAGCSQRVRVTDVPVRSCTPPAFAFTVGDAGTVSAIGELTTQPVYRFADDGVCRLYTPPADRQLRTLGPPLPDTTFLAARRYGER